MKVVFGSSLWDTLYYLAIRYFRFIKNYISNKLRYTSSFCTFQLRMEIRLQLVALWFVNLVYLFLRQNYVINAFVPYAFWHIFHDDRITFYFGTFELRMEERLQLRFGFVRYCDAFSITSQLHYSFVRCSYVFWWR